MDLRQLETPPSFLPLFGGFDLSTITPSKEVHPLESSIDSPNLYHGRETSSQEGERPISSVVDLLVVSLIHLLVSLLLLSSRCFSDRWIDPNHSTFHFKSSYTPLYSSSFSFLSLLPFHFYFSPSSRFKHTFRSLLRRGRDLQSSSH